jgi:lipoprotein-anchoring transpeptidase ErfK/SrfK
MNKSPSGLIKIHGLRNGLGFIGKFHRMIDWTGGCIAVTNREMEEIYHNVPVGTEIEIRK